MASSAPICDICISQQKSVAAEIWCLECEESLCMDCKKHHALSKGTRNHEILPINEYNDIPAFIFKVGQVCNKHNERFIVYCKDHASPGCRTCVLEDHKVCPNIAKIENVVSNIKSSNAFTEIEETLSDMSKNIEKLQSDRHENLLSLHEQKLQVEKDIDALRAEINDHLDKIQSQIINDLCDKDKREREKIESVLQSLSVQNLEIKQLQDDIVAVKKHTSDLQAFLILEEIKKRSNIACKKVLDMTEAGDFDLVALKHKEHKVKCSSDLASISFGKIATEVLPSSVKLITIKEKQAQLPVNVQHSYSIESVSLKLNRTINTGCQDTRGCVILPDGRSFFTCYKEDTITSYDKDGRCQYIKQLKPSSGFDIAHSVETDKIFISSGGSGLQQLHKMNLNNGNIESLKTESHDDGVVIKQNKLIYCARSKGLRERNLSDRSVRVIVSEGFPMFCYVTEYRDQLYYTNNGDHSVTCCRVDGRQLWKFKNDALKYPHGVSVDNYGNVYVVGSTNVVVISADGQRYKQILSKADGLVYPQVLYYQRSNNQLLVTNKADKAFLFDVSFI